MLALDLPNVLGPQHLQVLAYPHARLRIVSRTNVKLAHTDKLCAHGQTRASAAFRRFRVDRRPRLNLTLTLTLILTLTLTLTPNLTLTRTHLSRVDDVVHEASLRRQHRVGEFLGVVERLRGVSNKSKKDIRRRVH